MKRLLALLIICVMLTLTACDFLPNNSVKEVSFIADYDYGLHVTGKATLLLDGANVFFDREDWGILPLVAGDKITLSYKGGELLIQESYPSTIVTKDIEIIDITAKYADIIELNVTEIDGNIYLKATDESISMLLYRRQDRLVITESLDYSKLSNEHIGKTLYASGEISESSFTVCAIYDYLPRENPNK